MCLGAKLVNSPTTNRRSWFYYLGRFAMVLLIAAFCVGGWIVYISISTSLQAERTLHATRFTICLVEQFVHDKGRWPTSWDELERFPFPSNTPSSLNANDNIYEWPGKAKQVKECVAINFQIDQSVVANQDPTDFTAIFPIGPCYEFRDNGFLPALQRTLRTAIEAKGQQKRSR
jgi:hypothetical protein